MGVYDPPDVRAEITGYVYKVAILANNYRYLIAAYVQAYFEARTYDDLNRRISDPVARGLLDVIKYAQKPFQVQFNEDEHLCAYHMDMLLILTCANLMRPRTPSYVAQDVLLELLPSIGTNSSPGDFAVIRKEVIRLARESGEKYVIN